MGLLAAHEVSYTRVDPATVILLLFRIAGIAIEPAQEQDNRSSGTFLHRCIEIMKLDATLAILAAVGIGRAAPTPTPAPTPSRLVSVGRDAAAAAPEPTPVPALQPQARGLGDDLSTYVKSLGSEIDSKISSFVDSGLLNFPHGFPTGTAVESSLGITAGALDAQPTRVLNLPAYANWTNDGWSVRVHGNVYKVPDVAQEKIDKLADAFLIGTSVKELGDDGKKQARNLTREIFVVQQGHENVTVEFAVRSSNSSSPRGGAYVNAKGGGQEIKLPFETTTEGDFDVFVALRNESSKANNTNAYLLPGNATTKIQALDMHVKGTDTGNATAYLVPPRGVTVVSDIDDILRVTKIYKPKEGLLNSFARPFTAWEGMPVIYSNWSSSAISSLHFHYLTTTPEQGTRPYMDFIFRTYPAGSFDTRPLNFTNVKETLQIRRYLLDRLFQTFPNRTFVLVADTSNADVMKAYPAMYKDYPGQVSCILLRNTSATDADDKLPYDTKGFKDIPQENYMFFKVPSDLTGLDIENGHCLNSSVAQNVTFGEQGLPLGFGKKKSDAVSGMVSPGYALSAVIFVATLMLFL
ncbi:actin filament organization protein [Beauveria bassiana ARSEF 2860]|uniref:Actin filament organization protein n=1 Tax=Beauveria bassiana (strain ARSEF 2860) TaxID=655819 RepID=J5J5U1_BEAB2|nr:actin filament organization protein [Beauveria bassiana ARSEF 2860]EJP61928.1 actin filament organization protein [Beauveria bassiana ARSEF 2860]